MNPCGFCGLVHTPCDSEFCYCGEGEAAKRGEGFNTYCTAHWGDGA